MNQINGRMLERVLAILAFVALPSSAYSQTRLLGADNVNGRLIQINPLTGAATIIGSFSHPFVASLTWDSTNQILYATTSDAVTSLLLRVNPDTGATTSIGPLGTFFMHGIEYHPASDTLYGVASGPGGPRLYRINRTSGAATLVASIGLAGTVDIALNSTSGVMYIAEVVGQKLHTLNLTTGATTLIGPFNAPGMPFPQVGMGMAFDPMIGLLATDNTGIALNNNPIYRVNTSTGQATLIGLTGANGVLGLAFVPAAAIPGDLNCDGVVDALDVTAFALALVDPAAYALQYSTCSAVRADINGDGQVNGLDVQGFVALVVP